MKKTLNKTKEKSRRLVDKLLPGPRQQSPAPPDRGPPSTGRHDYTNTGSSPSAAATSSSVIKEFLEAARDGSDLFLPLKAALVGVVKIWDICERTAAINDQYKNLESRLAHLRAVTETLSKREHLDANLKQGLDSIATSFERLTICVEAKLERGMTRRVLESRADIDEVKEILTKISSRIEYFLYESMIRVDIAVHDILKLLPTTEEKKLEAELAKWKEITKVTASALGSRRVDEAAHDAQPKDAGCMPGTRVNVLSKFLDWVKNNPKRIFWLAGMAGTGKTSVAVTLCRMLQEDPDVLLGGSFFCSRTTNEEARTDVRRIIPTLAALLSDQSPTFAEGLVAELRPNSGAAVRKPVSDQMGPLLQQPLVSLSTEVRPIVFIIDALDECSDERELAELLKAVTSFKSPARVKFILTSRPETHIRGSPISDKSHNEILQLHTINSAEVTEDISLYIADAFFKQPLGGTWYTESDVKALADRAEGLFIFASTIIKYVLDTDSPNARRNRLQKILSALRTAVATGPLDAMYNFVLTRASNVTTVEPEELEATRRVLASILTARAPLSVDALAELLGRDPFDLREALRRLHAVVHVPGEPDQPGLRTLHSSFGDYLFERANTDLRVSTSLGDHDLANGCMLIMRRRLHFNVSQCRSSYLENPADRPASVTVSLEYACLYWIYHLSGLSEPSALDEDIYQIFCPRLLFWLETMSVLGRVARAAAMLLLAISTVRHGELSKFLRDAHAFVASSKEAIERSAAHIYLSALPFAAKDSPIYQTFSPLFTGLVSVDVFGIDRHGGRLAMTLTGHEGSVNSVSYFPTGNFIASGSNDGTVRIWDIQTGEETLSPLRTEADKVKSVAFAPGGRILAVATKSGLVYLWDLFAVHATPQRLSGHSDWVTCIAFSLDGSLLASGALDHTVRLWKVDTGEEVYVSELQEGSVYSIAFSTAGLIIASAFNDETIRLESCVTGESVGQPLRGHRDSIFALSFSHDGAKLASGSKDGDIRLWDIETGECIKTLRESLGYIHPLQLSPDSQLLVSATFSGRVALWNMREDAHDISPVFLEGHSAAVRSVTFSPDGLYIASASEDCTVRIWDVGSGESDVQPLQSHSMGVSSVTVSTEGTLIVSGSYDHSVRVWNASSREPKLPPLVGHTASVLSVTISSDGRLIASASIDCTIRVWDAQSGDAIGEPLQAHSGAVRAAVFSSDVKWMASGSDDKTVQIWNIGTMPWSTANSLVCNGGVTSVVFSHDSQLIVASDQLGLIHFWKAETGQQVREPIQVENGYINFLAFSPDGKHIASSQWGTTSCLWDISTGQRTLVLNGPAYGDMSIAVSSSGRLVSTGSDDLSVRIWDAGTGLQLSKLPGHAGYVSGVAFTPDERSIVSCSGDGTIRVWDVAAACARPSDDDDEYNPINALASTRLESGWLLGPSKELLLWVPAEYRAYLDVPTCTMMIGKHRIVITADENGLHHGENWTQCWRGPLSM